MEQKTAQFLVLFNHFYPLASKNLAGFIAYRHSLSLSNLGSLINMFRGRCQITFKQANRLLEIISLINTYINFSESYSETFLFLLKKAIRCSVYC